MANTERPRVLIAGLGNIFLGDDGFGVEVLARLAAMTMPASVRLLDIGTRTIHLAYELVDGQYDTVILLDLVSRGGAAGTLYVVEPDHDDIASAAPTPDAHGIRPDQVLALVRQLGGRVPRVLIVGCEPATFDADAGLSPVVRAAIDHAVPLVLQAVAAADVAPVAEG